ncbi:MAG: hypothetical protein CL927_00830 [Deltaproteobacteria bacterium]|nr:hypothetical protein [Deltaproteobacteria bacterium]
MHFDWPVLIINGDRDAADFVRFSLVDAGWDARRVQWTSSLAGARSHLRRGTPRVIVVTPPLPDARNEVALFDALREDAPDVPIVGISPSTTMADTLATGAGAHAYVSLADIEERLVDAIRTAITRLRFERQLRADQATDLDRRQSELIGRLADDAAFEVNNALAIVSAALTQFDHTLDTYPDLHGPLSAAREGVARAAHAMDGLLAAGGRRPLHRSPVHLDRLLSRERAGLHRAAGPTITVSTWLATGLPPVLGDASALAQVLRLLVGRAGAAMEEGGEVHIRAELSEDGAQAEVRILDDGPPPAVCAAPQQAEILRARALIESLNGTLDVNTRWPTGVEASISLPLAPASPALSPLSPPIGTSTDTRPTVLVVEDEQLLQGLLVNALEDQGYQAYAASDEDEARREASRLGHIDVLVTDVVLPKGALVPMISDLRAQWPKLAVVLMTGATAQASESLARAEIQAPVLAKPFRLTALFDAVGRALDHTRQGTTQPP